MIIQQCASPSAIMLSAFHACTPATVSTYGDTLTMSYVFQVAEARNLHQQYMERVLTFMKQHDLLCCPCVMVAPFDIDIRYALAC